MLLISCPWCGPRDEMEFACGGQSHIIRPDFREATDETWTDYLYLRINPKGVHYERWLHAAGCRRWFNVARNTTDHRILAVYQIGDPKPDFG
jgi:sarcosine oxidase subunit delta